MSSPLWWSPHLCAPICFPAKTPIHYHNNFNCEGGSKVRWEQWCCPPTHTLSESFCDQQPTQSPRCRWPFLGVSQKCRRAGNFSLQTQKKILVISFSAFISSFGSSSLSGGARGEGSVDCPDEGYRLSEFYLFIYSQI